MDLVTIEPLTKQVCRIGLGTWAIGGWMWGGTEEKDAIDTLFKAFEKGIRLIDTAPVYGFGVAEQIIGKALKQYGKRDEIVVATKVGLNWKNNRIFRDCSKERITKEIEDSLQRLQIDYIDLYQVHWPDPLTPIEETAGVLNELRKQGKIRAIGVSNYSIDQMEEFSRCAPLNSNQPPFNIFEKDIENNILEYCLNKNVAVLGYGTLCRGLLSGKMAIDTSFNGDDIRKMDPKFKNPRYEEYLKCVDLLDEWAKNKYDKTIASLAIRWALDKGITIPLLGARKPSHLDIVDTVWDWELSKDDMREIDQIVAETIPDPVGPEFMAPPSAIRSR